MAEQLAELDRLNRQTNALWRQGQQTNWESMSHTEQGVAKFDLKRRSEVHQGFMHGMITQSEFTITRPQRREVVRQNTAPTNNNVKMFNRGMMFSRYR